jgi:signal transduction histidine kinase
MIELKKATLGPVSTYSNRLAVLIFLVMALYSAYSIFVEIETFVSQVTSQIETAISRYDNSGELYRLQGDLSTTLDAIRDSHQPNTQVRVFSDSQRVAEWGDSTGLWKISLGKSFISKSQKKIEIFYEIQIFPLLLYKLIISLAVSLSLFAMFTYQKRLVARHLEGVIAPIETLTKRLGALRNQLEGKSQLGGIHFEDSHITELNLLGKTLEHLFSSIQSYQDEIRSLSVEKAQREIARQVAHDIRSPITALNAVVSSMNEVDDDRKRLLKSVSQRINQIADDLLIKSKPEIALRSEATKSEISTFDAVSVVRQLIEEKRVIYCQGSKCSIEFISDLKKAECKGNGAIFSRIISNLINNSYEAKTLTSDLEIKICVEQTNSRTIVSVLDNGCGIPPHILNHIDGDNFGRQYMPSSKSGSGLGIYHAKANITAWDGEIAFSSSLNVGTSVRIELENSID